MIKNAILMIKLMIKLMFLMIKLMIKNEVND